MTVRDIFRDFTTVSCSHGRRVRKCPTCKVKMSGMAFARVNAIVCNTDQTQRILNVVIDEYERAMLK